MSYAGKYSSGSTPPPGTVVETLTGNTGGAVGPNGSGNINTVGGNNITVAGNPGTNTLTASVTGTTNHALQVGNASGSLTSLGVATNGQIPIGSTGADPVLATLTAGTNISITNGAGSITINSTGGGSGITDLNGASGVSVTGPSVNLVTTDSGQTVQFVGDDVANMSFQLSNLSNGNMALGQSSSWGTGGNLNIAIGFGAGASGGNSVSSCIAIGSGAFSSSVSPSNCIAIGQNSQASSNGIYNISVGDDTLSLVDTGTDNVAVGYRSSSQLVSDATKNVSLGTSALCSDTGSVDGDSNVALGYYALGGDGVSSFEAGSFNIGIGDHAGGLTEDGSSNIYLNHLGANGNESNTLRIGASTGSGNQELSSAYICGIDGVDLNTAEVVTMASDQLGSATLTAGTGINIIPGAGVITIAATGAATASGFSAYLTSSVANATGDNTNYTIICDGVVFDVNGDYNPATGEFTAPVDGIYFFSANLTLSNISGSTTCSFFLNVPARPTLSRYNPTAIADATFGQATQIVTWIVPMTTGQVATISAQARNTIQTVTIQGDGSFAQTSFSGYLIG